MPPASDKENKVAAAKASSSENESSGQNSTTASPIGAIDDALLTRKVPCITEESDRVDAQIGLLLQSKTFSNMWKEYDLANDPKALEVFEFSVKAIPTRILHSVIDWCNNHVGMPDPVCEQDPATNERIWFVFTEYEKKFFEVEVAVLAKLLMAGDFLDLPSLYLYGCQAMAALIMDKNPEEIRELLGLEDDITEEEKVQIRKKMVWCQY